VDYWDHVGTVATHAVQLHLLDSDQLPVQGQTILIRLRPTALLDKTEFLRPL
jgi:hypothetical protein